MSSAWCYTIQPLMVSYVTITTTHSTLVITRVFVFLTLKRNPMGIYLRSYSGNRVKLFASFVHTYIHIP